MVLALSVVVPVSDREHARGEEHLRAGLEALERQTVPDLEILLVRYGAARSVGALLDRWAAPGSRFRVVEAPGATAAEARATGARAATGEYLAFAEATDLVPPYAYRYALDSLAASGSDFATGNVHRVNELGTRASAAHRAAFTTTRRGVRILDRPELVADRLLGNKVFRRAFFDSLLARGAGLTAPAPSTGTAVGEHEDLRVALPAHFLADAVDVLPAPVYLRRDLGDQAEAADTADGSDTADGDEGDEAVAAAEDTAVPADPVADRVAAVAGLSAFLAEHASDRAKRLWDATALGGDLRRLLLGLDEADDAVRDAFYDRAGKYLATVPAEVLTGLRAIDRLNWHLVRRRLTPRLLEVLTFQKSVELRKARAVRHGLGFYVAYPFLDDPAAGVPRSVYRLGDELRPRLKTEGVAWRDGALVVTGRVGLRFLPPRRRWQQLLTAHLVDAEGSARVKVPVSSVRAAEYRLPNVDNAARHDWGGFEVVVDAEVLRRAAGRAGAWRLELSLFNRGLTRTVPVGSPVQGPARRPGHRELTPGLWARPSWTGDRTLLIRLDRRPAAVTACSFDGEAVELAGVLGGEALAGRERAALRLSWRSGALVREFPLRPAAGEGAFGVRVPVPELLDGVELTRSTVGAAARSELWTAEIAVGDQALPLVLADGVDQHRFAVGAEEIAVKREHTGQLLLQIGPARPVLDDARWDGARLLLSGHYGADDTAEHPDAAGAAGADLVLKARGRDEEHLVPMALSQGRFQVELTPTAVAAFGASLPLGAGTYHLFTRARPAGDGEGEGRPDVRAEIAPALIGRLPLDMPRGADPAPGGRTVSLTDTGADSPALKVSSDLLPAERGAFAQRRLREERYPLARTEPLVEEIYFDSYNGRQFSDSPRALYEELRRRGIGYPGAWLVRDGQAAVPGDLRTVRYTGREYYEALGRSRWVVTNSRQPGWFERRPGQTVVQTWHGSMLKRIGFDIERVRGKSRDYHDKLAWEVAQWDYLVSPSPWATPILRQAFRFDGEILETGYPRNDVFHRPERHAMAERVRSVLGLPEGRKVLLYAPTWRDDKYYSRGKHKLDLHLDLRRMYELLGEDHVLLVRRHPRVVDRVPIVGRDFVFDVSLYPEIQELFLVTDVLITDYSSMMFDFANTGRPMLFFTYDIDAYRDDLRGFYFDFPATAPGPLLLTSDEVIGAVRDIDAVHAAHAERYDAFVRRFCPLDDGNAAARLADRLFAGLT
ncbi:bifunctional glycosyltransferase/CDP-glycerol:glycerophosphate glycerophosphotransferase [Allonocardiopsis opalescens]|uniref:bifunctional glycosyltransferase/CDP-glycerol:glycerophosphate glycerophosphotransferase n=1 Tax=Allonocardiopsis opalescens TaxID=1144618 RepID=UPI002482100A|nr:bifunctional glycosyltransferase/CDP-glycerol:glycerophosphate glycerophosphotransferase [Allonocardiopsis opalescens]